MLIDWNKDNGCWVVRDTETELVLAQVRTVAINCPCELVSVAGGRHGFLVVAGTLDVAGDAATIR